MDSLERHIEIYKKSFIKKTFIYTADSNYILGRQAFFSDSYVDSYWLSLHAIEKYMKAIIIINGRSTKKFSHDLNALFKELKKCNCNLPEFEKPEFFPEDGWLQITPKDFLHRLNIIGNPNNRYMLYGYNYSPDDPLKIDQIILYLRTFLSGLMVYRHPRDSSPSTWIIDNTLPLEKEVLSSQTTEENKFSYLNYSFFPSKSHQIDVLRFGSKNSPMSDWFHLAKNAQGSNKDIYINLFTWVIRNIKLSRDDQKEIEKIIKPTRDNLCLKEIYRQKSRILRNYFRRF